MRLGLGLRITRIGSVGAGYDSDAQAYFDATGTVSAGRKSLINALVIGLKADSLWTKLDRLWIFAAEDATQALKDIKSLTDATAVSSPTFTVDRGYAGNGSSSYLSTPTNLNALTQYTQNSAMYSVYDRTTRFAASVYACGAFSGTGSIIDPRTTANTTEASVNDDDAGTMPANSNSQGMFIATRSASTTSTIYRNGSSLGTVTRTSAAIIARAPYICCYNNAGTAAGFTTDQIAMFALGSGFDATQASNFTTRIETYMDAVGAGVI